MYGLKYGPKLGKPLGIEEGLNGKIEKPELDNARQLRGIYFIDPDDEKFEVTFSKCEEEVGSAYGRHHAVQKGDGKSEQLTGNWSEA